MTDPNESPAKALDRFGTAEMIANAGPHPAAHR
jgi:hypothetical protein